MKYLVYILIPLLMLSSCENEEFSSEERLKSTSETKQDSLDDALSILLDNGTVSEYDVLADDMHTAEFESYEFGFQEINDSTVKVYDSEMNELIGTFTISEEMSSGESLNYVDNPDNPLDLPSAPNGDHEGQDFCQCYEHDLEEFCDGLVGCLAAELPLVKITIAVHCVIATGRIDCDD